MTPEDKARVQIDAQLGAVGWDVQDLDKLNLGARVGVAVREFPLE
jgi:type I restriction enzyme R subunit